MQRQLRAQAQRARQALALLAERSDVSWSFRVARGAIAAELLSAAAEADLTILGKTGWSLTRRRRLEFSPSGVRWSAARLSGIVVTAPLSGVAGAPVALGRVFPFCP